MQKAKKTLTNKPHRTVTHCITCGSPLDPDYGESFKCLDCAWWAEQKARREGEKLS